MRIYYTDGSALPNPGHGGYAVILNSQPVALGSENPSTNIRMEAKALIAAIKHAVSSSEPYKICTDSQFWINVVKIWAPNWEKRGWHKKHSQSPAGSDRRAIKTA
jgi:ribonuclease HI